MKGEKTMAERKENGVSYEVKEFIFGGDIQCISLLEYKRTSKDDWCNADFQIVLAKDNSEEDTRWKYAMILKGVIDHAITLSSEEALSLINDLEKAKSAVNLHWINLYR